MVESMNFVGLCQSCRFGPMEDGCPFVVMVYERVPGGPQELRRGLPDAEVEVLSCPVHKDTESDLLLREKL